MMLKYPNHIAAVVAFAFATFLIRGSANGDQKSIVSVDGIVSSARNGLAGVATSTSGPCVVWSPSEISAWLAIHLRDDKLIVTDVLGGSEDDLLVLTQTAQNLGPDHSFSLGSLSIDGTVKTIESNVSKRCAFFDRMIGGQIRDEKLLLTSDGGRTWKASGKSFPGTVKALTWIRSKELIISSEDGRISLLKVDDDVATTLWTARVPVPGFKFSANGGDVIWMLSNELVGLKTGDGTRVAHAKCSLIKTGLVATPTEIYVWGMDGAEIWNWDNKSLQKKGLIETEPIAQIVYRQGKSYAIGMDGRLYTFSDNQLTENPVAVKVIGLAPIPTIPFPSPSPEPSRQVMPAAQSLPSEQELDEESKWSQRVSFDELNRVMREVGAQGELTPKQRINLLTEKLKALVASTRPAAATQPVENP